MALRLASSISMMMISLSGVGFTIRCLIMRSKVFAFMVLIR